MDEYKLIKISDISLYEDNPRFDKASSNEEAIFKLVQDQNIKLLKLAEHIIDNGFNPIDIPIVFKKGKKLFVKEGNRRIVSLMLVNNPNLIFSNESLKKKFLLLKSQKGHLAPTRIFCAVFSDQSEADKWIKLKHSVDNQGAGTVKWNSQQSNRFAKLNAEDLPIDIQAIEILKKHNNKVSKDTLDLLPSIKVSNLKRLLTDPYVRNKIGLQINKSGLLEFSNPKAKSLKNLEIVVHKISDPNFAVDNIYYKEDKKNFIDSMKLGAVKKANQGLAPSKSNNYNLSSVPVYTSLIDPDKKLSKSTNSKISSVYKELQTISVDIAPHATAFLLRVLIEISVKTFLKNKGLHCDADNNFIVTISGSTNKLDSLNKKIDFIGDNYIKDHDFKKSINLLNSKYFIYTLNQVVHNDIFLSTPSDVRDFWINAEKLFEFLV